MLAVVGDRLGGRIVLQREVQRDAVGGQRDFLRGIGAVVTDVVPRRCAGDEGRVKFLDRFQRGDGLLAVDDDVACFIEQGGVVRPQHPVGEAVAVALALPSAKPAGFPAFCSLLAQFENSSMILRDLVEPTDFRHRLAVDQGAGGRAERQPDPGVALAALAVCLRQRQPAAVTLAEVVGDVGQFDAACRRRCAARRRSR